MLIAVTIAAQLNKAKPSGWLSCRPQGAFFSNAMIAPSTSMYPTLPVPTTNISSMIAQQHPTQNAPWCPPSTNAFHFGRRPRQYWVMKLNGVRQRSRQRYFNRVN